MVFVPDQPQQASSLGERRTVKIRGPGCLLTQLTDSRPLVRRWGVRDLAGFPHAAKVLLEQLPRETDDGVREVILATLGGIGGEMVIHGLMALLGSDDTNLRNGALEVLSLLAVDVVSHLSPLLNHSRRELRATAVEILHRTPPRQGRGHLLERLAQENDVRVVGKIMAAMGKQGLPEDIPLLQQALQRFANDSFLTVAASSAIHHLSLPADPLQDRLQLRDDEWSLLQELLQTTSGRQMAEEGRGEAEEVILQLAGGYASFQTFLDHLSQPAGKATWTLLLDRLFPLPRYFFHGLSQLKCLAGPVMEDLLLHKPRGGKVRIWCHSTSGGVEPYSLAMALQEYCPHFSGTPFTLVASEEANETVNAAKEGIFPEELLVNLPGQLQDRYFNAAEQGMAMGELMRNQLSFSVLNLDDPVGGKRFREFDMIICRDLLSRRDPLARRRAAALFLDALTPGGYLFLGDGETMSTISGLFRVRGYFGHLVFQKPLV